jgi:ABC-type branched-subunit amino acid transport system ATPase component
MTTKLKINNLHKSFGGINAVNKCSFEVEDNTIVALIGPNGAGKTTIFNLITGFMSPDEGKVVLEGEDITNLKTHRRAQKGLSRTFQIIRLFPKMTVMDNMLTAMKHNKEGLLSSLFQTKTINELETFNKKRAMEYLKFVNLDVKVNELASDLSYGQQKLLEIAKALASEPEILLLDEPAAGVNKTMLNTIKELLLKLKKQGKTILFIEHDMEFVMNIADKVVVLDYGKEIAVGTPQQIQKNKKVIDAYLGVKK